MLFAKRDYLKAAATIHSVLAVGPGWNWATLIGLYDDVAIYTEQLRALETYRDQHPRDSAVRFLLAYHYLVDGFRDAAATQLERVVKLEPGDTVAADLLRMLSKSPAAKAQVTSENPTPLAPADYGLCINQVALFDRHRPAVAGRDLACFS